jgi:hypothetical protein
MVSAIGEFQKRATTGEDCGRDVAHHLDIGVIEDRYNSRINHFGQDIQSHESCHTLLPK